MDTDLEQMQDENYVYCVANHTDYPVEGCPSCERRSIDRQCWNCDGKIIDGETIDSYPNCEHDWRDMWGRTLAHATLRKEMGL